LQLSELTSFTVLRKSFASFNLDFLCLFHISHACIVLLLDPHLASTTSRADEV
jgi:hypothetical protein